MPTGPSPEPAPGLSGAPGLSPRPGPAAPRHRRGFQRLSIRHKLLVMALVPLLVVLPLLGLLLLWWGNEAVDRLLITKVRADLAVANGYFERVLGEVGASTAAVADSQSLHAALARSPAGTAAAAATDWPALLEGFRQREGLDFLNLRLPDGRLLATQAGAATAQQAADAPPGSLQRSSVEVLSAAELAVLAPALAARVPVPLRATRNAAPTTRTQEDRAMVLLSTRPVLAADGRLIGQLQGGLLLNRNLDFIDHINAIVYPQGGLPFQDWGSQGTATLFLDDVRISTNVRLFGGESETREARSNPVPLGSRAIGTRVSQAVREAVLVRGDTWLGRAFVVSDWYVSGYQPLLDGHGRAIGMLYVGFLERPFTLLKYAALASVGVIFFAVMTGAALHSLRWARGIFKPLERMEATMLCVEGGDLSARVGAVAPPGEGDEIARLAGHLDHLLGTIEDNTRALQRWNAELDAKVAERTAQLEAAQAQLVQNEKLAAVGQLTAGIAHEVNNPIAVIQGNLDLVRELLGPQGSAPVAAELALVDAQIERMRLIVTRLLQFARPAEFAGYVEAVDTARALDDSLVLVNHLLARSPIRVQRDLQATRPVALHGPELQQVLVNLLVNAIQAMPEGGTLGLASRDLPDGQVEICITDSGPGLAPGLLATLFQPFVTRKKEGTGLGLWICRSLLERYGATITGANREEGTGAVFRLSLPVDGGPA